MAHFEIQTEEDVPEFAAPPMSSRAIDESKSERDMYRAKFQPPQMTTVFNGKFLDVDLAIRMLERSRKRRALICELFAYLMLVTIYCIYLLKFVTVDKAIFITTMFEQAFLNQNYLSSGVFYKGDSDLPDPQQMVCELPFNPDNVDAMLPWNSSSLKPGVSYVSCAKFPFEKNFWSLSSLSDVYNWLEFLLLRSDLFPTDENNAFTDLGCGDTSATPRIMPDRSFIPVGAVQLRQVRVNQAPCVRGQNTSAGTALYCPLPFSDATESKSSFFGAGIPRQEFVYSTAEELARVSFTLPCENRPVSFDTASILNPAKRFPGILDSYPQGGFVLHINGGDAAMANETFQLIKEQKWLDSQSVALFISFTAFSTNLNTFVTQSFLIELSPFGLVVGSSDTISFKLSSPGSQEGAVVLEILIMTLSSLLLIFFFWSLLVAMRTTKFISAFFTWVAYDILNLTLVVASVAVRTSLRASPLSKVISEPDCLRSFVYEFQSVYTSFFTAYSDTVLLARTISSISLIVCFLKFFKYVDLNKRFSIALTTLVESRIHLLGWFVFAFIVIGAFCVYAYFSYGWYSTRFSSFGTSIQSILLFTVQVFTFPILGPTRGTKVSLVDVVGSVFSGSKMSWKVFQIADFPYTFFFASSVVFTLLFVVIVLIIITNFFQAILIFAYQNVNQVVVEDEELQKEQSETRKRSKEIYRESWLERIGKDLWELSRFSERNLIISRLKTAPETRFRNLLSYNEVVAMLETVLDSPVRAKDLAFELMSLYQTELSRIDDAVILFKDRDIALMNGRRTFHLDQSELPLIEPGESYDPAQRENWLHDLQSGDMVQSMLFVHCLHLEQLNLSCEKKLRSITSLQRDIEQAVINLEASLRKWQHERIEHSNDFDNPWAFRNESVVEPRLDGRFDAHHVSESEGHIFLGTFDLLAQAQEAIKTKNDEIEERERILQNAKATALENSKEASKKAIESAAALVGLEFRFQPDTIAEQDEEFSDDGSEYSSGGESDSEAGDYKS